MGRDHPRPDAAPADASSGRLIAQRYLLLAPIGQGGMGKVSKARDRLTGQIVALKQVRLRTASIAELQPSQERTFPFDLDVTSGGEARSDTLRSVTMELGTTGARRFRKDTATTQKEQRLALAQEFRILASLRHPNIISVLDYGFDDERCPFFTMELLEGALPLDSIAASATATTKVELVCQILMALSYLHRHGVIHRDIKPANVLGARAEGGWRIKVLDFGLASSDAMEVQAGGTLAYMAPELFAGQPASASSDIYAAGMVLAELLLGAHPFAFRSGEDAFINIKRIQLATPDLSRIENPALAALLGRALNKQPAQRPADAATFMRELAAVAGTELPAETAEVRDSYLIAAPFTGREAEIRRLLDALHQSRAGQGSSWLIFGESGVGKSRILEELRSLALISSVLVFRGQAVSAGGSAYQLWREILRPFCLTVPCSDVEASVLGTLLPDLATLIGREVQPPAELEASAAQTRLLRVIVSLLGRQVQPVLLLLEDLQWADEESLSVLRQVSRMSASRKLMIAATARQEEAPQLPAALPDLTVLTVERLSTDNLKRLCESMLGPAGGSPGLLSLVQSETEGNAYFAVEVIRALAEESGSLESIVRQSLPARVLTGGIQQVLRRRLDQVPPSARPMLRLAAVAGRQLDSPLLARLFSDAEQLIRSANAAGVLEMSGDTWRFSHDKLREFLLADIQPAESRALHALLAETLDRSRPGDATQSARIAYHYHEALRLSEAAYHYAQAGEAALVRGAVYEAVALLRKAAQLHEQCERPKLEQVRVWRGLAQASLGLRRNRDIGEALQRIFALIGHPLPTERTDTLLAIGRQSGKHVLLRILRLFSEPHADEESREIGKLVVDALHTAQIYLWIGQADLGWLCLMWRMNLVEELNLDEQRTDLRIGICGVLSLSPLRVLNRRYLDRIEKERPGFAGKTLEKIYLSGRGYIAINQGEWQDYLRWQQAAVAAARLQGDEFGLQRFLGELIFGSLYGEDARTLHGLVAEMTQRTDELPIRFYTTIAETGRGVLAWRRGELLRATELLASACEQAVQESMPQVRGLTGGLLAECWMRLGDQQKAEKHAERILRGLAGLPLTIHSLGFGLCGIIEVYLIIGEKQGRIPAPLRSALSYLRRLSEHCLITRPSWERCRARTAWLEGDHALAIRSMQRSLHTAVQMGTLRDEALAHYFLAWFARRERRISGKSSRSPEQIRAHLEAARRLCERVGETTYAALARAELG